VDSLFLEFLRLVIQCADRPYLANFAHPAENVKLA
jgi:hypothetical protein